MIKTYKNVLKPEQIFNILKYCDTIIEKDVWTSNIHWQNNLGTSSSLVLQHRLDKSYLGNEIKIAVENAIQVNFDEKNLVFLPSIYVWTSSSYIKWHDDGCYPYNGTIYLNKRWDSNNGGIFLYKKHDGQILGMEPAYNSMVVNSSTESDPHNSHCVTPIIPGVDEKRVTIQWRTSIMKEQHPISPKTKLFFKYC